MIKTIKSILIGKPRDPLNQDTRKSISLVALLAWVGLGADGVSSSAYGPENAYLALGAHHGFSIYLGLIIGITVFIISFAYNQVIELFPSGGGGYKVATRLIGPYSGLVSGVALILGYVLTIAISFASGVDAIFSMLPIAMQKYKLVTELILIIMLMYLNLRGMKESITFFMPLFLGFVISHVLLVIYAFYLHFSDIPIVFNQTIVETKQAGNTFGWFFVFALIMQAYSLGGGTYTGLEAVSNNVNNLAEPRVETGKLAMLYMAMSLSFIAGGILILYAICHVAPEYGKTLNAVTFASILSAIPSPFNHIILALILFLEAGILFVGANTGFFGGPSILANMAIDGWVPRRFRSLSSRLVVQNGILIIGVAALIILFFEQGVVSKLIIIYSSSVFLTFNMSLLGLSWYWWKRRKRVKDAMFRLAFSLFGFLLCFAILATIILTKFMEGGWLALIINGSVIGICLLVKRHYNHVGKLVQKLDQIFTFPVKPSSEFIRDIEPDSPTAVFYIGDSVGEGMHTLLWAQRMFSGYFKNFVFASVGIVDVNSYESDKALRRMQDTVGKRLKYFVEYANQHGIPATSYESYGTDHVQELISVSNKIKQDFKLPIFFAARIVRKEESWLTRILHSETPALLQRYLHLNGMQMIILPVTLD